MFELQLLPRQPLIKFNKQLPIFNWSYPFDRDEHRIDDPRRPYIAPQEPVPRRTAVYIHIPFCETICTFCPYKRDKYRSDSEIELYVSALIAELELKRGYLGRLNVDTIFVGGGTPSLLSPQQIETLGRHIHSCFKLDTSTEFTFEVEVKSVSRDKLRAMLNIGVNRVSFGVQTFVDEYRALFSLDASEKQIVDAAALLNSTFAYTNLDLLYGLPGQTRRQLYSDIIAAISLKTTTIDVYPINNLSAPRSMHRALAKAELRYLPEARRVQSRIYLDQILREHDYTPIRGYSYAAMEFSAQGVGNVVQHFPKFRYHDIFYGYHDDEIIGYGSSAVGRVARFNLYNLTSRQAYIREVMENKNLPHLTYGPIAAPERGIVTFPYRGLVEKSRVPWLHVPEDTLLALRDAVSAGLVVESSEKYELTKHGWLFYVNLMYYLMPTSSKNWVSEKIEHDQRMGRTSGDTDLTELINVNTIM